MASDELATTTGLELPDEKPKQGKGKGGRPRHTAPRVEDVKSRLLQGVSEFFLRKYSQQQWGVSPSQARRYIQLAKKLIRHEARPYTDDVFLDHLATRRDLRKRAHAANDLKLVLEILKDEAALLDLYSVKKNAAAKVASQPADNPIADITNNPAAEVLLDPKPPTSGA